MSAAEFDPVFQAAGAQNGVDPHILKALAQQESNFDPKAVNPETGAAGIMQYIPASAKAQGLDPMDPVASINQAAKDFAGNMQRFNGNVEQAVAAHFAGPNQKLWGPKTTQYVSDVASKYAAIRQSGGFASAQSAPAAAVNPGQPDDIDAMLASRAQGNPVAAATQPTTQTDADPLDAMLAARAVGQQIPASAAGGSGAAAVQAAAGQPGMLASLGAGLGHGVQTAALGAQQLVGRGASAVGLNTVGNWLTNDAEQGLARGNADYAPYAAAHPIVAGAGNIGGQIAGTAPTMLIGPEYAGLSLAGKLGLGAAQGASGASMMPVENPGNDFWTQKAEQAGVGGALGAATPLAAAGAGALGRGLWNVAQPVLQPGKFVGQGVAGAMSPAEAAAAASNIRNAQQFVPGYQPGTAALAQSPFLIQTEKAAGNLPGVKTALMNRNISNNAAVWDTLNQVGGTDLDLKNAIGARDMATIPLYNIAKQQPIPVDAPMTDLMSRPAMQTAIDRAQKLASNTNAGPIFQTTRIPNSMGGSATTAQTLTGNGAQAVKESLDAMLLPENTQKLSGKEIGALQDTRSAYIAWLEGHSPAFTQARQTYAGMSPPINTMTAGQQMAARLGGLGRTVDASQNPIITAPGYATALDQALKGQEFGIEPAAQATLENIGHELQRSTALNSVPKTGSDTAYNLAANGWLARNLYGPSFQGATGLGKSLAAGAALLTGHPYVAAGVFGGANKLGQMVGNRLQGSLTDFLMNPNAVLPYLDAQAASASQPVQGALAKRLLQYGRPALVNGISSGLVNAP